MSDPLLSSWSMRGRVLLAVAAPAEAKVVLAGLGSSATGPIPEWRVIPVGDRFDVVVTGVGKANAAGAVARVCDRSRHSAVVNVGVAGVLPGSTLSLGSAVLASESVYADEGVITPGGFITLEEMGLSPTPGGGVAAEEMHELAEALGSIADTNGVIATVSTCSGTDVRAIEVRRQTKAVAEAMEGAAVEGVIARINRDLDSSSIPFAELRVISNTTGARDKQQWDLERALNRLQSIVAML